MSYILDALKKSEQERSQGGIPGLNSVQEQPHLPRAPRHLLFYLLGGFLLSGILAGGLVVFFRPQPAPPPEVAPAKIAPFTSPGQPDRRPARVSAAPPLSPETTPPTQNQTDMPGKPASPARAELAETAAPTVPEAEQTDAAAATEGGNEEIQEYPSTRPSPGGTAVTNFESLPAAIRNALPELTISAHYYSSSPAARMASINGRIMRQGQNVGDGLVLKEIIREGVIFSFRGFHFIFKVFAR